MVFDPQRLLSMPPLVTHHELTKRDTILYALGVGAEELAFTYEENLVALPTMAVIMAYPGFLWRAPEFEIDWQRVLHGEQSIEVHSQLPTEGKLRGETTVESLYDKGKEKGSVVRSQRRIFDQNTGVLLATVTGSTFLRGNGGHGGSLGSPPAPHPIPDRPADRSVTLATAKNLAAIYRLSGDYNPLHIDPAVARAAGFEKPILHGLCTYGVAGRALLQSMCGNDPARLTRMDVRFSTPIYPGETIVTEIWVEGPGRAAFRSTAAERGAVVLNNGYVEFD